MKKTKNAWLDDLLTFDDINTECERKYTISMFVCFFQVVQKFSWSIS